LKGPNVAARTAPPGAVGPTIGVTEVSKQFDGVVALDRVSLTLWAGEVHALVGENGAGKSTLIKIITGVYQPDGGVVRHRGDEVHFGAPRDAQAAGISTIYQELNLVPLMSVARNLFLGREPRGRFGLIDFGSMHRSARELLARYDLSVDVRRPLGELGLGVQQMVAMARAVSGTGDSGSVVIMDEPTSSLEPREVDRLAEVIGMLRADGVAVLYVTHKLDEVFRLAQQVTVLRDGRRVHTGRVADTDRLGLVAMMLGRNVAEVREHGRTRFGEAHTGEVGEPVLRAVGLTRRHALAGVDVDVHAGEVVGLAGLLGSGRSETARAIFGIDPLDSGTISVAGADSRRWSPAAAIAAGVGMVSEDRKAEGIIVDVFVKRLRIKIATPDQPVRDLSGGNQQKVLLARMLCLHPRVLLLDEPTRGIDVGAKAEIQALVDELAAAGLGVVLISSELEEVVEGATRVLVLRDGAVVGVLTGDQISENKIMTAIAGASTDAGAAADG
jgi:monosaccharide-transporting ATPase